MKQAVQVQEQAEEEARRTAASARGRAIREDIEKSIRDEQARIKAADDEFDREWDEAMLKKKIAREAKEAKEAEIEAEVNAKTAALFENSNAPAPVNRPVNAPAPVPAPISQAEQDEINSRGAATGYEAASMIQAARARRAEQAARQ